MCVRVCARACLPTCVHACVRACVCVCVLLHTHITVYSLAGHMFRSLRNCLKEGTQQHHSINLWLPKAAIVHSRV